MAFTSWFMMGDEAQTLTVYASDDMKMRCLDVVTMAGNSSLVACFKQELQTSSCLLWHTIKNHLSVSAYNALLVRNLQERLTYECAESSEVRTYDGFSFFI